MSMNDESITQRGKDAKEEPLRAPGHLRHGPLREPLLLADSDRRIQEYLISHLDVLIVDRPPQTAAGIMAVLRVLYQQADYRDPASAKLWCALSVAQIAAHLGRNKGTVSRWLEHGIECGLISYSDFTGHVQRRRHRPNWPAIASHVNAAACAGRVPGPPLFAELLPVAETVAPVNETVSKPLQGATVSIQTVAPNSQTVAGRNGFDSDLSFFHSFSGGGTGGKTPFKGGFSPVPTTPEATARKPLHGATVSNQTVARRNGSDSQTENQPRRRPVQLLLDFGRSLEEKIADLANRQQQTHGLCERILNLVLGLFVSPHAEQKPPRAPAKKSGGKKIPDKNQGRQSPSPELTSLALSASDQAAAVARDRRDGLEAAHGFELDAMPLSERDALAGSLWRRGSTPWKLYADQGAAITSEFVRMPLLKAISDQKGTK